MLQRHEEFIIDCEYDEMLRFWPLLAFIPAVFAADPTVTILLPEKTRLLVHQRVDLVIEGRNLPEAGVLKVTAQGRDITAKFSKATAADLDCDSTRDFVWRSDLHEFETAGLVDLKVEWRAASGAAAQAARRISVQAFTPQRKNLVLFIGDAMGNAYRDAARIVARSTETKPGVPGLRQGFFDRWNEMDEMPVTGLAMTYGYDTLVPDSAQTATHWSTGNKPLTGALSALPDGTDCEWRSRFHADRLAFLRDNPRIESLLEYLKRRHGYRTGVVSTAFITDATPAAQGSHTPTRGSTFEVARHYLEDPVLNGQPAFDLILGGGKEDFDPDVRADGRDLVKEFGAKGFQFVKTAKELAAVPDATKKLLGLFRRPNQVKTAAHQLSPTDNGNMDVAYDKLGLLGRANTRPGSEPLPDFGEWRDQPFLEAMTQKAIAVLSQGNAPFALQVEGAHIDKQSHPNHAAGVIWDAIELDHAVGVARRWAKARPKADTLVVVSGDHDQSMTLNGVVEISDADLTDRKPVAEVGGQKIYKDVLTNLRSNVGSLPASVRSFAGRPGGHPDYIDADGDGYPENREVNGKGRHRLSVGFRTGGHAGTSLPVTAEGPGALFFTGYMDQTDIFFKMASALGSDTSLVDQALATVLRLRPALPK